jgi:hypothetical protein
VPSPDIRQSRSSITALLHSPLPPRLLRLLFGAHSLSADPLAHHRPRRAGSPSPPCARNSCTRTAAGTRWYRRRNARRRARPTAACWW